MGGQLANTSGGLLISVTTPPGQPGGSSKLPVLLSGLTAGLLVGVIAAFSLGRRDKPIRLADGICKVRRHLWQIPGIVGTSSWAHHVTMNEFADQSHQPPDDPRAPLVPAHPGGSPHPAHPGGSPPDTRVSVRIFWDAAIPPPVTRRLGEDEWDWFRSLASPGPDARKVWGMQDRDFTLSAGDGFVVDSPALPPIAVVKSAGVVNVLLRWPLRPDPSPPWSLLAPMARWGRLTGRLTARQPLAAITG